MPHLIQCSCGRLKGTLSLSGIVNRCVCYCANCQAFARFLERTDEILDQAGGTEIVQVNQEKISFTQGVDNLACMRLTENGTLRWYASCCSTPIGNTPVNHKASIVGLIHSCLHQKDASLDEAFGPIHAHVYTKYAKGESKPKSPGFVAGIPRLIAMAVRPRLNGGYKRSPFFNSESGMPVVEARVLSNQELWNIKNDV